MENKVLEIKNMIRETEKMRQEMTEKIGELQLMLSSQFMTKLRQCPSRYGRPSVDDEVLKASQELDELSMEYLALEKKLDALREKLQELMAVEEERK
jgi:hypothetical protein